MIICSANLQAEENVNMMEFKRLALRDAVICIGWLKLISVIYYVCLYFMVHVYSKGDMSLVLQILLLIAIPLQVLHGTLLFYGALESKLGPLETGIWLCLILASYNTILGTIGCIYFIRMGHVTLHFFIAFAFLLLACSLFTAMCHDVLIVYAYKQIICRVRERDTLESVQSNE